MICLTHAGRLAAMVARFFSRSRNAVIRVYDEAGDVIETYEHSVGEISCQAFGSSAVI